MGACCCGQGLVACQHFPAREETTATFLLTSAAPRTSQILTDSNREWPSAGAALLFPLVPLSPPVLLSLLVQLVPTVSRGWPGLVCMVPADSRMPKALGAVGMQVALWSLGLGSLLLSLRAAPIGKRPLPLPVGPSGNWGGNLLLCLMTPGWRLG